MSESSLQLKKRPRLDNSPESRRGNAPTPEAASDAAAACRGDSSQGDDAQTLIKKCHKILDEIISDSRGVDRKIKATAHGLLALRDKIGRMAETEKLREPFTNSDLWAHIAQFVADPETFEAIQLLSKDIHSTCRDVDAPWPNGQLVFVQPQAYENRRTIRMQFSRTGKYLMQFERNAPGYDSQATFRLLSKKKGPLARLALGDFNRGTFSLDGRYLAAWNYKRDNMTTVRIYDLGTDERPNLSLDKTTELVPVEFVAEDVRSVSFSGDARKIAVGYTANEQIGSSKIAVWNIPQAGTASGSGADTAGPTYVRSGWRTSLISCIYCLNNGSVFYQTNDEGDRGGSICFWSEGQPDTTIIEVSEHLDFCISRMQPLPGNEYLVACTNDQANYNHGSLRVQVCVMQLPKTMPAFAKVIQVSYTRLLSFAVQRGESNTPTWNVNECDTLVWLSESRIMLNKVNRFEVLRLDLENETILLQERGVLSFHSQLVDAGNARLSAIGKGNFINHFVLSPDFSVLAFYSDPSDFRGNSFLTSKFCIVNANSCDDRKSQKTDKS